MKISIDHACDLLQNGKVVAIPTETVYGLAASLSSTEAIEHIFTLKQRPPKNPLIIHVAESSQVTYYTKNLPKGFQELASTFWPGPLTLVLPAEKEWVPSIVRAGLETVAFRIPSHPITLQVLKQIGPLVMPSANMSGRPSATHPKDVEADFGAELPIIDGGVCHRGVESTILFFDGHQWEVARLGAITPECFESLLGYKPAIAKVAPGQHPVCPGQLYRHYAPDANLILDAEISPESIGNIIGFSDRSYPQCCRVFALGPSTEPETVAKNLYKTLRVLDQEGISQAWVDTNFPSDGLWVTVGERLWKAGSIKET